MSGNPVKIGDGYATVTGYKLPGHWFARDREGGSEVKPEVRISVWLCSSRFRAVYDRGTNFSVKRRMRPARPACAGRGSLNAFIPRLAESEGFLFEFRL